MNRVICDPDRCTGCAACREICPKHCISMQKDSLDALHPVIDESLCIDCGGCTNTCPNNHKLIFCHSQKVWVAWSEDKDVRRSSASGGVAYELYRHWLKNGGVAAGVTYTREEGCHFILIEKEADIATVQNSKYTFSDTWDIYRVVKQKLQAGIPVLFIAVPCQVAGLLCFLKKEYSNLTTVDLICHGMPPATYLQQHIDSIESHTKEHTNSLFFRDPKYYTYTYTFTLKNKDGREFYKKKVLADDDYQLGYHKALIYRENCYSCNYARKERISDLTIGDFCGLGNVEPVKYDTHNVSCILQNTDKGATLLAEIGQSLTKYERPANEAFDYEKQLRAPSLKHRCRALFETEYKKDKDFERAADIALAEEKKNAIKQNRKIAVKNAIKCILPMTYIRRVKMAMRKNHGIK